MYVKAALQVLLIFQTSVSDSGNPPLSDTTLLTVAVEDVNDNEPFFVDTVLSYSPFENQPPDTPIGEFLVSDSDQGLSAEMSFTLQGDFAERWEIIMLSL